MTWHVLDIGGGVLNKEFTSALAACVPTIGWLPVMNWSAKPHDWEREQSLGDPPFRARLFPLQRGYSYFPLSWLYDYAQPQLQRMLRQSNEPEDSPLICTTPFWAPVAERWRGPVVYYQTDLTFAYASLEPARIRSLDRRLCKVAAAVCPNSFRLAQYMVDEARCDPSKIDIIPNATRADNILSHPTDRPGPLAVRSRKPSPPHRRRSGKPGVQPGLDDVARGCPTDAGTVMGFHRPDSYGHIR